MDSTINTNIEQENISLSTKEDLNILFQKEQRLIDEIIPFEVQALTLKL